MEIPIKILKKKYRDSTIQTMTHNIKRVLRDGFDTHKYSYKPLMDRKAITKYLETIDNLAMRKTLLAAILAFVRAHECSKDLIEYYENMFDKLALEVEILNQYKMPTELEKYNWISWEEVIRMRKHYKKNIDKLDLNNLSRSEKYYYQKYVILSLYTYLAPLRGGEFLNSVIVSGIPLNAVLKQSFKLNYFDIDNQKFIINDHKRSQKYGKRIIDIPNKLCSIIRDWQNITGSQWLIPSLTDINKHMTGAALTNMFFLIFDPKNISTSMLRKIFISRFLDENSTEYEARKKLAYNMGHSLATQEFTYSRFKS